MTEAQKDVEEKVAVSGTRPEKKTDEVETRLNASFDRLENSLDRLHKELKKLEVRGLIALSVSTFVTIAVLTAIKFFA